MSTVELIPPDPAHAPEGESPRALLYPLWVIALEIRPYPRAAARTILFSVDGVRGVPLPIARDPETTVQEVPDRVRLVPAIPEERAGEVTRAMVKEGLGFLGGRIARLRVTASRKVYKLFWILDGANGQALVDSRSGTSVPMPDEMPLEE